MGLFDLFIPTWQSDNKKKALKAVEKEISQIKLAEIAKNAPLFDVRKAAVDKLIDQILLSEIVIKNKGYHNMAVEAVKKLTDQSLLVDVAISCTNTPVLMEAVKKLTDQKTLTDFAQNSINIFPRVVAIDKLSDQTLAQKLFDDIIKEPISSSMRIELVRILTNQSMLAKLAQDLDWQVRVAAVEKLTDQKIITEFAKWDTIIEVRIAAAKKMTDRHLVQTILEDIEKNKRVSIATYSQSTSHQPKSYDEFFGAIRKFLNARDYNKVETEIEGLTNQDILSKIANSKSSEWCIDRGSDNFGPYNIVNLCETAQNRLEKLKKTNILQEATKQEIRVATIEKKHTNFATTEKPNNDLFFIIQSLKDSQKVMIKGLINGAVVMTPKITKVLQQFPRNAECLYQLQNLTTLSGLTMSDLLQLPIDTKYYGTAVLYHGFPTVCLKCRKPVTKFELLMATVYDAEAKMNRVVVDADNAQEILDVLKNIRYFIAVPCCDEHSLANHFFFWMGISPIFTDDKDIADTCMKYSSKPNLFISPVRVIKGKIID